MFLSLFYKLGNIYKMSRNKDRYESSSQRRQQTFMSTEDVASGRKTNWTAIEITGAGFFQHSFASSMCCG